MTTRLFLAALYSVGAILLLFLPELTKGRLLFGVALAPEVRESIPARSAIAGYRAAVFVSYLAVASVCFLLPAELLRRIQPLLFIPMSLVAVAAFNWERHKLRPLAQPAKEQHKRSVELSGEPDRKGGIALLGSLPIMLLSTCAVALHINWAQIPQRVAVHFGTHGPDRWLDRSRAVVFGPVLIGLEICSWLLLVALVAWSGMRRCRGRSLFVGLMLWLEFLIGSMFSLISLTPTVPLLSKVWVPALLLGTFIVLGIIALMRLQARGEAVEPTSDQCWKAGLFYFNRNDPALLVEVREGNNFMLNFANPVSWAMLAGTVSLAGIVAIQIRWFFT